MQSDSPGEVFKSVSGRLEHDTRINLHHSPITIKLEENAVVLEGEMGDIGEKRAAVDAATRALFRRDHWQVVDHLEVKPAAHKEDLELKESIARTLLDEGVFKAYTIITKARGRTETLRDMRPDYREITAAVQDGHITMNGQVESLSHRRMAEVLMWWTEGCRYVDNRLEIVPPEQDNDYEINDAVLLVLEKDPLVHSDQLRVSTAGGVVELHGFLATREEKHLALLDAWCVPGVSDVVDRIDTRD